MTETSALIAARHAVRRAELDLLAAQDALVWREQFPFCTKPECDREAVVVDLCKGHARREWILA